MSSKQRKVVWSPPILKVNKKIIRKGPTEPLLTWWHEVCQIIFAQTKQHDGSMLRTLTVPCCPFAGTYLNQALVALIAHLPFRVELKKVVYRAVKDGYLRYHYYTLLFSVADRPESPLFCLQLSRMATYHYEIPFYISEALSLDLNSFLHPGLSFNISHCSPTVLFGNFLTSAFKYANSFELADRITSLDIHRMAHFLRKQTNLTSLTLHLWNDTLKPLCKTIRKTSSLTSLCLSDSLIEDSHLDLLFNALFSHASLHRLDLSNNRLTAASLPQLTLFLPRFESLQFLNLDGNLFPSTSVGNQLLERSLCERLRKKLRLRERSLQIRCWIIIVDKKIRYKRLLSPFLIQQMITEYSSIDR